MKQFLNESEDFRRGYAKGYQIAEGELYAAHAENSRHAFEHAAGLVKKEIKRGRTAAWISWGIGIVFGGVSGYLLARWLGHVTVVLTDG